MSDVTVKLTLQEDISAKLQKASSSARTATSQMQQAGKAIESAFKTSAPEQLASKIGQAFSGASAEAENLGNMIDSMLGGKDGIINLGIKVDDNATAAIGDVEGRAAALNGTSANVGLAADDSATPIINSVEDVVSAFDGQSASAEIGAEDNASQIVAGASDKVSAFDGQEGSAEVGAEDNASSVIDAVTDKAEAWDGSVWEATVSIVDGVTAPLSALGNLVKNPLAQAGTVLGIGVGVNDVKETYADFEATMSQVKALADATDSEMESLTEKAKEMGAVTKYSGTESAEAFTYMAQAGWTSQQMIDGIGGIMSLAASDGIELAEATDIVANALTSFQMQASDTAHFADVLAVASSATNTDVHGLGEAFKYVAPVAGAMKYSVEDVSLALGIMSNNAVKGSMAGTTLKTSLANLAAPTDKMQGIMDKYNISLTDSEGNMKSLREVLDNLREGMGGLSEAQQTAAASTLFGKEAMAGMLAIINTSDEDYASLINQIDNATGAADRMAETMQDNLAGTLEQLGGAVETVELSFGERMEPYITDVANVIADSMPAIEEAGMAVFDYLDGKVASLKRRITDLTTSKEWKNADLFGKIDIAWNELIGEPFLEWAGSEGATLISGGMSALFSEAGKILPGGEDAGIMSWLSAGLLAKGGVGIVNTAGNVVKALTPIGNAIKGIGTAAKTASSVGGFVSELSGMIPTAGKIGLAAAGITAAVIAIKGAVDEYNATQIENSLTEHFGNIELSQPEIEDMAGRIINVDWLANINLALGEFENAEEFHSQAEEALNANKALIWKAGVQMQLEKAAGEPDSYPYDVTLDIKLTPEMQEDYKSNIETYLDSKTEELNSLTLAAATSMETILGDKAGEALISQMQTWAADDTADMSALSSSLTQLVQDALEDGVLDVEEQAAIEILQEKINSIVSGWKEAQADAEWQTLEMKWSGKDLTPDSFTALVEEARAQRQSAIEALDADTTEMNAVFNGWLNSGKIDAAQRQQIGDLWKLNYRNAEGEAIGRALSFASGSISDAYGDLINSNLQSIQDNGGGIAIDRLSTAANTGDWSEVMMAGTLYDSRNFYSQKGGSDRKAMLEMYESMKPDVSDMQSLIDAYRNEGSEIPQAIMDSYNKAIEIGAASGDTDAAWQHYANSIMESGNDQLIDALTNESNPMYETLRNEMAPELASALDRAVYAAENTTDSADLSELFNTILGLDDPDVEIDTARLAELCEKYGLDISEYLSEKGIEVDGSGAKMELKDFDPAEAAQYAGLTATGNAITLEGGEIAVEYEVTTGDTLSGIAEKTGVALEELQAANQHILEQNGSWDLIYEGDLIYVPQVEADTSGVAEEAGQAAEEAQQTAQEAAEATDQTVETEGTVNAEYTAGEVTGAEEAAQEVAEQAEAAAQSAGEEPKTVPASIVIELESIDDAALSEGISGALAAREEAIPVEVPAAVTVQIGSVDSSALSTDITSYLTGGEEGGASVPVDVPAAINVTAGEINTSETTEAAVSQAQSDLDAAFAATFETAGSVNVTLTETNNVPAIYSEVGGAIASAFAQGYSASASVGVTLYANYSLANPTATISFGGGAAGSATVSASLHAKGGYFDEPHLGMVAEAGVGEYIIPIDGSERSKAMWADAGQMLGIENYGAAAIEDGVPYVGLVGSPDFTPITKHAAGGYFDEPHLGMVAEGGVGEYILPMDGSDRSVGMWQDAGRMLGIGTPQRSTIAPMDSTPDAGEPTQPQGGSSERTVNVNINGSGTISVSGEGMTKEQVVDLMLERAKEVFMSIVEQEIVEEGDGTYEW